MAAEERESISEGLLWLLFDDSRAESSLNWMVWRLRLICFAFQIVDLVVLDVLLSFVDVPRWKLRKMVRDL